MNELRRKINKMLDEARIAGASVGLSDREGIIYAEGFGRRIAEDESAVTTSGTLYRAASITKVVTALAVMRLYEAARLDLDTPVLNYLDWFSLKDTAARDSITLRHLLSHRSGLPGEYTPEGPLDEGELVPSLMAGLPELELVSEVGGGYLYSNWGYRLVTAVIEAVAGERYSSFATRSVLRPLGMSSSRFFLDRGVEYDLSMPHERDASGAPVSGNYIKENYTRLGTGGLYSNAPDLLRLARALMHGGVSDSGERIISADTLSMMMEPLSVTPVGDRYGLALQLHAFDGICAVGHYGSAPPYSSALFFDPEAGYAAVALLNTDKKDLRRDLVELLLGSCVRGLS